MTMTIEQLAERIEALEHKVEEIEAERDRVQEENENLRERVEEVENENDILRKRVDALETKAELNKDRVAELQSRSLETGAHLLAEHVPTGSSERVAVDGGKLEKITKEDGRSYLRLPGEEDALDRGGAVAHSTANLLPIQRLARYDDEMLAKVTSSEPAELAARAWRERENAGRYDLWSKGSAGVRVYLSTSDLAEWIRSRKAGCSKKYSQELARRTKDALLELAKGRLAAKKKKRRADGLQYREWRIILHDDVDLPGEIGPAESSPATAEAAGAD